ncbi:N amino acid transport system [Hyphodiscus hymeniophilus]|uniref:N amino acid transport system n=1 Tax=Hyphodiscus hymeniophilus TaxID=353542 RepID=A0A9P6VK02_9HELO|nr:N amino acid transport system [Hyphodiscus hymeniophilus]
MALNNDQSADLNNLNKEKIIDNKLDNGSGDVDTEKGSKNRFEHSAGKKVVGGRIAPVLPHLQNYDFGSDDSGSDILGKQIEMEASNAIQYRTCSWQKTAALLFSEYICLAIMSFPYSYSVLGLVPGLILTVVVALIVLYTSLVVWEFCLRHPEVRDVCDIGQMLFWGKTWAWYATAVMFVLNNTFIQGLHVLTSAKYLNTITNHSECTIVFAVIATLICWVSSLPRTFDALSKLGTASAFFTFISVLLAAIFAGIEAHPYEYNPDPNSIIPLTGLNGGEPTVFSIPQKGTTFVAGMSAFLNISYTFIGQITLPSFIAEMRNPRDFPKALWVVTICEIILFSLVGAVVYAYTGTNYNSAPAFGSLGNEVYKKVSFSFMIPTLIFLGVLYASVSARFIFFRVFEGTRHKSEHTVVGWAAWAGILGATWLGAFIIAEVIPFFSDLLSLMSSLFDSFFGFIFWGVAYIRMRRVDGGINWLHEQSAYGYMMLVFNIVIIAIGFFFLGAGTYTSVQSIINSYAAGAVSGVFTCKNNGI